MDMKKEHAEKIAHLQNDIAEIDAVLNDINGFDCIKAEQIIRKHNATNTQVAEFNSPRHREFVPFERATPEMLKNNLINIRAILGAELAEELLKVANGN